ncbi:circadian clock protein KaiB [Methylohalomonas lacus]|uniref:Circadian clock protein KaiB n=1 Tax=Methylohalomonas lacus TaxID=398773 RepID=A0AAE3HHN0_9GAMM|nr:circadian clock KaiB family protein [Methylohalomonas lacus]MCS3902449.1 circadian clock protein KaiB [Methylohalomonas lacus]
MNTQSQTDNGLRSQLVLFTTGDSPRSMRARSNLKQALKCLDVEDIKAEEIDLIRNPDKVLEHGVFATPALVNTSDSGQSNVLYGDFSDLDKLKEFLRNIINADQVEQPDHCTQP